MHSIRDLKTQAEPRIYLEKQDLQEKNKAATAEIVHLWLLLGARPDWPRLASVSSFPSPTFFVGYRYPAHHTHTHIEQDFLAARVSLVPPPLGRGARAAAASSSASLIVVLKVYPFVCYCYTNAGHW